MRIRSYEMVQINATCEKASRHSERQMHKICGTKLKLVQKTFENHCKLVQVML